MVCTLPFSCRWIPIKSKSLTKLEPQLWRTLSRATIPRSLLTDKRAVARYPIPCLNIANLWPISASNATFHLYLDLHSDGSRGSLQRPRHYTARHLNALQGIIPHYRTSSFPSTSCYHSILIAANRLKYQQNNVPICAGVPKSHDTYAQSLHLVPRDLQRAGLRSLARRWRCQGSGGFTEGSSTRGRSGQLPSQR